MQSPAGFAETDRGFRNEVRHRKQRVVSCIHKRLIPGRRGVVFNLHDIRESSTGAGSQDVLKRCRMSIVSAIEKLLCSSNRSRIVDQGNKTRVNSRGFSFVRSTWSTTLIS